LLAPGAHAAAAGAGYWRTSGNQILDANGEVVRIAGINWYGFETTDKVIHGLWAQDWHNIVNTIKGLGYNVVRMPFSDDMVSFPINPTNIGASNGAGPINRDVIGLDSLAIMDRVIQSLGDVGIRVILDNHRSNAGNSAQENGLWYTADFSEQTLVANWVTLVRRYKNFRDPQGNPIVIGADLRNEPHLNVAGAQTGACWTGDTATAGCPATSNRNWPKAAERIGNAILAENPNLLVVVEGAECYNGDCDWWGGNLQGVATNPVVLSVPNRIVYSAHDYGPNLFRQKWFTSSTTCQSLATVWDKYWGYISAQGIAPVLVGEFGANNGDYTGTAPGSQGQWFQCLASYIKARPNMHWTYWALNGEDDYGLLTAQYDPVPPAAGKQAVLAAMQFPLQGGGGVACATPNIPQSFTATAVSANRVDLRWSAVPSPGAGCAITYDVFRSTNGTTFTPSAANRVATGVTATSFSDTTVAGGTTYYYLVESVDVTVASPPSSKTSATTPQGGTTFVLTVTRTGTGTGTVTSSTGGINCGTACTATLPSGTTVTLTAAAASGFVFGGWSGACTGSASTCVATMTSAQSVGASFLACAAPAMSLTVTKAGTGAGTVTSSPAGISCGTTCTMALSSCGAVPVVLLTATPASGSVFTGWSGGGCSGTSPTCSVTVTTAVAVTATFTLGTSYSLTVTKAGTGSGTVTSSAGGINCGTACAATLASGTTATLTATAAQDSTFTGWTGACTGTGSCIVSMTANRSVTATFNANPCTRVVTVTKSGTGTGTVTSGDGAIACGTTCVAGIACSASLTLTATPASGSAFTGWGGACTGTAATCTVSGGEVTATFGPAGTTPCANPITFTGNTGNFNTTGAACYRTAQRVNGWGCSNFSGRTVSVNAGAATTTCGAGPFPLAQVGGYTYFSATAGQYPWASIYLW
jgi:endoglucanase